MTPLTPTAAQTQELIDSNWGDAKPVFATVRNATDHIRTTLIPELLRRNVPAQEAFYEIHRAEGGDNVPRAVAFPPVVTGEDCNHMDTEGKNIVMGRRRLIPLKTSHAWHPGPEFLPDIEAKVFAAADNLRRSGEKETLDSLAALQASLRIAHLPIDISGRTTEDFLVFLSHKHAVPLSISKTGYRGIPRTPSMKNNSDAQAILFDDMLFTFDQKNTKKFASRTSIQTNGYFVGTLYDMMVSDKQSLPLWDETWLKEPLVEQFSRHVADTAIRFAEAASDNRDLDALAKEHQAFPFLIAGLRDARQRTYRVLPGLAGTIGDATMAAVAFAPIAGHHWHPDYIAYYGELERHLSTGIQWMIGSRLEDLAEDVRKEANAALGSKSDFHEDGKVTRKKDIKS